MGAPDSTGDNTDLAQTAAVLSPHHLISEFQRLGVTDKTLLHHIFRFMFHQVALHIHSEHSPKKFCSH